ncbi:MAG: N-acetylneuraminate epimerase precursor [Firmicutes bacterium ADurb.Bin182]|nr:MAG: N-acetylneuraminate epimerase precursor [Firmicutes bacterium ADurb.Bin182]
MKRTVILFALTLFFTQFVCACSDMESAADGGIVMPEKKMSLSAVALDDCLYVLGGMIETGEIVSDFAKYDLLNNEWTQLEPMPVERAGAAVVHQNGRLYVFGGRSNSGLVRQVDVYCIESGKWESAKDMPYEAWNLSAESCDGKIYLLGGISGTANERRALNEVYIFDPGDNSYEQGPPLPYCRHDAASAVLNRNIYLMGGKIQAGPDAQAVDLVSVLDVETMRWSELAPLPGRRVGMKGTAIGGKIYVAGGNSSGTLLKSVDCYDPDTDTWSVAAELSAARSGHAAASLNGMLYVAGGSLTIPKSAGDIRLSGSVEAISIAQNDPVE